MSANFKEPPHILAESLFCSDLKIASHQTWNQEFTPRWIQIVTMKYIIQFKNAKPSTL